MAQSGVVFDSTGFLLLDWIIKWVETHENAAWSLQVGAQM